MFYDQDGEQDGFDFVKKILLIFDQYFDADERSLLDFTHELSTTGEEKYVTIHPTEDGLISFCVLTPDQLEMVESISQFSNTPMDKLIPELAREGDIPSLVINPKDGVEED